MYRDGTALCYLMDGILDEEFPSSTRLACYIIWGAIHLLSRSGHEKGYIGYGV